MPLGSRREATALLEMLQGRLLHLQNSESFLDWKTRSRVEEEGITRSSTNAAAVACRSDSGTVWISFERSKVASL